MESMFQRRIKGEKQLLRKREYTGMGDPERVIRHEYDQNMSYASIKRS